MDIDVKHLVFLYSIGAPICMHKSQFRAFAAAMYEAGHFQKSTVESNKSYSKNTVHFYRILDKSGRTLAPYVWPKWARTPVAKNDYLAGMPGSTRIFESHHKNIFSQTVNYQVDPFPKFSTKKDKNHVKNNK